MGTWEEESSELLETQNEVNVDASSNGTHHDEKHDGDVEVETVSDGVGHDHRESEVVDEDDLVERLERLELPSNGRGDSEFSDKIRGGDEESSQEGKSQYPVRPYAVDCSFYVKTGTCKFGQNCRYNHPLKGDFQPVADMGKGFEETNGAVGDAGKIDCKYFTTPGGCKYGDACRYNHSSRKFETERSVLNFLGLPIRPSAQECTFYLRNGSCAYGANCRFNHPDPSVAKELESGKVPGNGNGISERGATSFPRNCVSEPSKSFGVSQATSEMSNGLNLRNGLAYAPEMSSYHQAMPQNPGWTQNQAFSSYPTIKGPLPHQVMNNYSKPQDPVLHHEKLLQIEEFPERPGQPDCDYFLKTGNCKYRSACRYNHPMSRASKLHLPTQAPKGLYSRPATVLPIGASDLSNLNSNNLRKNGMPSGHLQQQQTQNGEFPERPGQPECEYYMKTGQCKFKSACRYHHPKNRVSTPSLCALSEKGLPLRPGAKLCRNFEQQGNCKYGRNCLFNHPDEYSSAAQVAVPVYSSANVTISAAAEPSALNNVQSGGWDDGWGT